MNATRVVDLLWNIIEKHTDTIFGLPGGVIDDFLTYIPNTIKWINVGNELQNGFIAQIYGYYTNSIGILAVTHGPGIATALSALQNAVAEEKPLVVISFYDNSIPNLNFQQWNILPIVKNITKYTYYIETLEHIKYIQEAINKSKQLNTCAVILFNKNIFTSKIDNYIVQSSTNTSSSININELNNKKLLVVIGDIKPKDFIFVKQFIKNNQLPYVVTWKGRLFIDDTFYCGMCGSLGNHSANYAILHCTHILIFGNISKMLIQPFYKYKFSLILETNKQIVTVDYNDIDDFSFLNKTHIIISNDWKTQLSNANAKLLKPLLWKSKLEQYAYIAAYVYHINKLDIPVTTGVGNHWYAIGKYFQINHQDYFESATNWSSIGIGLANGIGMYLAFKKPIWIFEGDGGILFSANNIFYLLNHANIPLTVTIYINNLYAAVSTSHEIKKYKPNNITNVVENLMILPNSYIFDNCTDYYHYLIHNPISTNLRFIIIKLGNNSIDSNIYEININESYKHNLQNNLFNEIIQQPLVLKSE